MISQRVTLVPLSEKGEHLSVDQLQRRALAREQEVRCIIPEPVRADMTLQMCVVAQMGQLMLEVRMGVQPQQLLPLDNASGEAPAIALAREVASCRERIEAAVGKLYEYVDGVPEPLTPREEALLRKLGGETVHFDLSDGPVHHLIPDEPSPVEDLSRTFSGLVIAHYCESVSLSQVCQETERGAVPIRTQGGQLSLVLLRDESGMTDALHRAVAEIFIKGRSCRLRFIGRAMTLRGGKVRQIIFERLIENCG